MRLSKLMFLSLLVSSAVACAPISDRAKADLEKPVSCQTAQQDIKNLKSEKASVARQVSAGLQDIVPASAVVHLFVEQNYMEGVEVATGEYNQHIDAKIVEIKSRCRVVG